MSLKAIHVVFIVICILLAAGFSAWCFGRSLPYYGTGSAAVVPLLVVYLFWFVRKSKRLGGS